jgi:LPXTG-motif cell wall-anchored protein
LTADEAKEEGLVPPKTATMMPAYAMIGLGSLLLGLFLLRQRASQRRRRY